MVVNVENRYEVKQAGDEDATGYFENQPLEMHVAWFLFALHVTSIVDDTGPVLLLEDVEEHVIVVTTDRVVVECTELWNHVYGHVTDYCEVHIDTGPEDQWVHDCVEKAGQVLACTQPKSSVLEVKPRGVVVYVFHDIHTVNETWIYCEMHDNGCGKLCHQYWEIKISGRRVKDIQI